MRSIACLLVPLCLSASMLCAQDQPKFSPAEQEVVNVRDAMIQAAHKRDLAAWSSYVAEDCIFTEDNGSRLTKAQVKEHYKLPLKYDYTDNPRDYVVHLYGNVAVLNFRFTWHELFGDVDIVTEGRATQTYIKQSGSWLLIAAQSGAIPINVRKPAAVDPSIYKDYVGQYEWRPLDDVETISARDGKLWTQSGKEVDEYLPLGADSFFIKSELGISTFSRDAQGRVTGYVYRLADGQEIHVNKIK
jgi:hypothetical protein